MTVPRLLRCPARRRSQAGFTLIEVMITVAISVMVTIPLLAWMVVGFKTQQVVERSSANTTSTNQLVAFLPNDIASSSQVVVTGGLNCSDAGLSDVVLLSVLNGNLTQRIVYLTKPEVARNTLMLVRRTCPVGGASDSSATLVAGLAAPSTASVVATCSLVPSRPADLCGRVDVLVNTARGGRITATGSRRAGSDS